VHSKCISGSAKPTRKIPPGRPPFVSTQRDKVLRLLRDAGARGVRREDLLYIHRWSQAGTRIHELERMGYVIEHILEPGQRMVTYRLVSEPLGLNPPQAKDENVTGNSRASEADDLPLFEQTQR